MKKIIALIAILLLSATARAIELSLEENRGERGSVGYVDMQRLFTSSPDAQRAKESFENLVRQAEENVNMRKAELLKLRQELDATRVERDALAKSMALEAAAPPAPAPAAAIPAKTPVPAAVPPALVAVSTAPAAPKAIPFSTPAVVAASTTTVAISTAAAAPKPREIALPGMAPIEPAPTAPPATIAVSTRAAQQAAPPNVSTTSVASAATMFPMPEAAPIVTRAPAGPTPAQRLLEFDSKIIDIQADIAHKESDLTHEHDDADHGLLDVESRKTDQVLARLYRAVSEVARREGVSVVIDKSSILYGHQAVDLTDRVLKYLKETPETPRAMKNLPAPMTVAEIAALVGGHAAGDERRAIASVAEVASAGPNDVASFHNMKYLAAAQASPAGCLLVPPAAKDAPCAAKAKIVVADPQAAFALLLGLIDGARRTRVAPGVSPKASVHPEAKLGADVRVGDFSVIERGASVGDGTTILPQCYVGENAKLGKNCLLHPRAVVRQDCELGDGVTLHPGVVIGADGFGFTTDKKTGRHTKIPQIGNVVVGDGVEIGANTTVDRATLGSTVIESGAQIDNLVMIAHNVRIGRDSVVVAQAGVAGSTSVGRNVILAGQAGVAGHLTIGDGAVITAQTGVMSDAPPKAMLFGSPGRPHREAFKLQALYGRLPEFLERLKEIEKKLGATKETL